MSLWKVYHVDTGKVLKAGFQDEDEAKDWLDSRRGLDAADYVVEEMDNDEEEEYIAKNQNEDDEDDDDREDEPSDDEEEDDEVVATDEVEDDFGFGDDEYLDPDEGILGEVGDDDDDGGKDDY